ncbi:Atu4866 domain-containing protein [Dongia sp.]|uniref:Atu4866 domain-containing protein n=1 Tax=Dongia sp. TaxID=1977262 RepID=UPI0035B0FEBE
MLDFLPPTASPLPQPDRPEIGLSQAVRGDWVDSRDGLTRLSLTGDGRYSKTQGDRQGTYSGRYSCKGTKIRFVDDFDFVLTGEISGDVLRIGDYVYLRA